MTDEQRAQLAQTLKAIGRYGFRADELREVENGISLTLRFASRRRGLTHQRAVKIAAELNRAGIVERRS